MTPPANPWTSRLVGLLLAILGGSSAVFVLTGYSALYHAWVRADLAAAVPHLSWTRGVGVLAVACAIAALVILIFSNRVPIAPTLRLSLSLLAAITIALFSEFRNEGKFYFRGLHHFLLPGEWLHDALKYVAPSLGDFLYRLEYSHLNDFLIGPAIVSALYPIAFASIYQAFKERDAISRCGWASDGSRRLADKLQAARLLMQIGLFWFFIQAWAEKAGYIANRHSRDAIDLPFELAGTVVGLWMARVLTMPFDERREKFRSSFLNDLVARGWPAAIPVAAELNR